MWIFLCGSVLFSCQHASGAMAATVSLFMPAHKTMEWILTAHDGAKGFRAGDNCTKCHGGDEQSISNQPIIALHSQFELVGDELLVTINWAGEATAKLSVMFDAGGARAFVRAGCWAACHSDIRGLDGTQEKYLGQTRSHMTTAGGGTATKDKATLQAMRTDNNYVNILQLALEDGALLNAKTGTIAETKTLSNFAGVATANWQAGQWQVTLALPVFSSTTVLGFALLQPNGSTLDHYVSLPLELRKSSAGYGLNVE
jgi:hypothetical protein